MEAELAALAMSGATALVNALAGDGWSAIKARVVALLRRGSSAGGTDVESRLDTQQREAADALRDGDQATLTDLEAEWRVMLRRLLREDPQAAAALQELIAENTAGPSAQVSNTITGGKFHGTVVQAGDVTGGITIH